ncbi:MAG: DNA primase [Actinobacteria bacterium]|nr:MAG: DNA primase [Actinomycetota bacterium]
MPLIKEDDVSQVKERVNLVDLVSDYVTLKKAGRYFKGLCPFHKEKTSSFMVDPDNQIWHCFGCGEGGNAYSFVMKIDHLDFPQAVETLAKRAGYNLTYLSSPQKKKETSKRERLYKLNEEVLNFYTARLMKSKEAEVARNYLNKRGYNQEIAKFFNLGYAPNQNQGLYRHLIKKGYKQTEISELGLINQSTRGTRDRFFNRLMFSILDIKGRPIGFGGRVLREADNPKYMNSPESLVYHKSQVLYALNWAKAEIVNENTAYVVEGYTDVISLYKAGIKNVVATCGTALTADHLIALSRFADKIVLLFDADEAGLKAASRVIDFYDQTKSEIYVLCLPKGMDPADFADKEGSDSFKILAKKAKTLIEFCLEQIITKYDPKSPKSIKNMLGQSFEIIAKIGNSSVEQEYLAQIAKKMKLPVDNINYDYVGYGKKSKNVGARHTVPLQNSSKDLNPQQRIEEQILGSIIGKPDNIKLLKTLIDEELFLSEINRQFYKTIINNGQLRVADIVDKLDNVDAKKLASKLILDGKSGIYTKNYLQELANRLKELSLSREIIELKSELEKINPVSDEKKYDLLFKQLIELEAKKRDLR